MIKTCHTCALTNFGQRPCALYPNYQPESCSNYTSQPLNQCDICGNYLLPKSEILEVNGDKVKILCISCSEAMGTCKTCANRECKFETDPSPIPKVIQKQIRQGNMTAVTQVMNPERIEITCKKGCACYSQENGCSRQNNMCKEWKEN